MTPYDVIHRLSKYLSAVLWTGILGAAMGALLCSAIWRTGGVAGAGMFAGLVLGAVLAVVFQDQYMDEDEEED